MHKFSSHELESLFNKAAGVTLAQVFSCEICEIFRNTYFEEHLRTADSANTPVFHIFSSSSVLMKPINKDSAPPPSSTPPPPATLLKATLLNGCFSSFSNYTERCQIAQSVSYVYITVFLLASANNRMSKSADTSILKQCK